MRFLFDRVENCRARNTIDGFEIVRRVTVLDIPVYAATEAWRVLIDIIADPQCPRLRTPFPEAATGAQLEEQQMVAIEREKRRVELDLVYRSSFQDIAGGGGIIWTVADTTLTNHVTTVATAAGKMRMQTWYKAGDPTLPPAVHDADPTGSFVGYATQGNGTHRITTYRGLRVTGRLTGRQWADYRPTIRALKGKINKQQWGLDPRGTWLFLGPNTTTVDRGNTLDVELNFVGEDKGHFPLLWYVDPQTGHIPPDIATEELVRSAGLPPEGGIVVANGVTLASNYEEGDFSVFSFDPETEPTPG